MPYNTRNPIGSNDPRDLDDNARAFDRYSVGDDSYYDDRLGRKKLSMRGQQNDFEAAQAGRAAQFQAFLQNSGYEAPVSYAAGVTLERATQTFVRNDVLYRVMDPADLPYTLTGDWSAEDKNFVAIGDGSLRQELAGPGGASLVYTEEGESVEQALKRSGSGISPFAYGALGGFQGDDTDAVAQAIAAATSSGKPLLIDGKFRIKSAQIAEVNGFTVISNGGVLLGMKSGTYTQVLEIKNCTDLAVIGRLIVGADYNVGYDSAVKIWADTASGCSLIDLNNVSPVGAKVGFTIGDVAQPDRLVSEITIAGGHFYGCPGAFDIIGTQTVVTLSGVNAITGINNGPAGWDQVPRVGIRLRGSMVNMVGGELMLTDSTNGLAISVEPIASPVYSNPYGQFTAVGVCIESASQFANARNPDSVPNPGAGTGLIRIADCPGFHSQNLVPLFQSAQDFTGRISLGANDFFCTTTRTQPNIQAANVATEIFVQRDSFGRGFNQFLGGVSGGTLRHDRRLILAASELSNQPLPNGSQTTLVFKSSDTSDDRARWFGNYSTTTGVFTVPPGGLRDVEIRSQFVATGLTNGEMYIQIDGVTIGVAKANVAQAAVATVGRLTAGQQVRVVAFNAASGAGIVAASGPTGNFTITAAN